jgi:hypothetical protein
MSTWYTLANFTKRERIEFAALSGMQHGQIVMSPEAATMVASYMLNNIGDDISFVPDEATFRGNQETNLDDFTDVTDRYIDDLLESKIFVTESPPANDPTPDASKNQRKWVRHAAVVRA